MKSLLGNRSPWALVCNVPLLIYACTCGNSQTTQPSISNIYPDGTNVVVEVAMPPGFHRVTLQTRSRLGSGTWTPAAVGQNDGSATKLRFRVACTSQAELIRVQADAEQPLPPRFYSGTNTFTGPMSNTGATFGPAGGVGVNGAGGASSGSDTSRAVVESDIWQIDGSRLYFFNQYRGLQVIDISVPDNASILGTLSLPASGEQMYLADSNHLILLATAPCSYSSGQSQVIVVGVSNNAPAVVTNLMLGGWFQDSRMVGTALYIATQNYRTVPGTTNTTWEWGTQLTSFDLSDPEKPVARNTLWFSGYGNIVSATDTYLFVVTQDPTAWWQSSVQFIDITSPDGRMDQVSSVSTTGRVPDKFKLNYTNGVFTAISEDWRWNTGTGPVTKLETFRLPDPRSMGSGSIIKLGQLELGSGEQLHATRFDGNLVYVVTFFQIDPLWVVDLSDPANPSLVGSVNVPGWSSYIAPMGDRLVTVGLESHRVAVSLFDVHDPTQPALLSHLVLGENYSWSDATSDEKAFTVLPEQQLVLVPYNGDTTNGWTSQVQLIDLTRTNLVARGMIRHQLQPRRTAFAQNRVLSLSGWELLSVDVTDRDTPVVKGDAQLAWPVDRVFAKGDYLLELSSSSGWWGYQAPPAIRVTPAHQHDTVLNTFLVTNLPIVGASLKNDRLYIAQSFAYFYAVPLDGPGGPAGGSSTNPPDFFLTVLDMSHLPDITLLGQTSVSAGFPGWGTRWVPVWTSDNVLVWVGGGGYFGWIAPFGGVMVNGLGTGVIWPWWSSPGGQLLAFDVGNPTAPSFDSKVDLATNGWWSFSSPFENGTRVYLSHSQYVVQTNSTYPDGIWSQVYYLDVVDYADPLNPTLRKPVNIPGTLQGLSHEGELLYTLGFHWGAKDVPDWTQWLDASAYDGVSAHLVDSLPLSNSWPQLVLVDTNVFIADPGSYGTLTNFLPARLETWSLSMDGKFTLNGSVTLNQPASALVEFSGLLAAREWDNSLEVFDESLPASLSRVAYDKPTTCLWYDLTQGDGEIGQGLWLPLGAYGVKEISLGP